MGVTSQEFVIIVLSEGEWFSDGRMFCENHLEKVIQTPEIHDDTAFNFIPVSIIFSKIFHRYD